LWLGKSSASVLKVVTGETFAEEMRCLTMGPINHPCQSKNKGFSKDL
jgi:hypothetical protein